MRFKLAMRWGDGICLDGAVDSQQVRALVSRQHRQLGNGLQRVSADRRQKVTPVISQTNDGRLVKNIGGVSKGGIQLFAFAAGSKHQITGRSMRALGQCLLLGGQIGHAQAAAQLLVQQVGHHRLVIEHHLEQRVVALAALRLQGIDDGVEWQFLMRLGTGRGIAHGVQQIDKARLRRNFTAQYLGVDEAADQAFGFTARAVGDQAADANIGLPAVAMQQALESRQQNHEQGHTLSLREIFQAAQQFGRKRQLQARAVVAGQCRVRTVCGQFQYRVFCAQLLAPVIQLALLFASLQPAALPDGVIAVLHSQWFKGQRLASQQRVVTAQPFVDQHVHRPAVSDHVVQVEQQQMFLLGEAQHLRGKQRPELQVEGLSRLLGHRLPRVRPALLRRQRAQVDQADIDRRGWRNTLKRTVAVLTEGGAQAFMTLDQRTESPLQQRQLQRAVQAHRHRQVVRRAVRVQLPEKPHALLSVGQAIAFGQPSAGRDREQREIHVFLAHASEKQATFFKGQLDKTTSEFLGVFGVHGSILAEWG
ncbi:Peptide synthase PvdJ [Pseudomonas coronafaciens pv. garcae]|nr:Peptide synthase PvdJ [Pseudomonas coronafaciens pv. garcae]